jgi:hypothetical protein
MRPPLALPESVTSFSDYFRLNADPDQVLEALGYSLTRGRAALPMLPEPPDWAASLQVRLEEMLPLINLTSEAARREMLVAPVLIEVSRQTRVPIHIEYTITVNDRLKGPLDYLLRGERQFLVVEAKNEDTARGFTQLAAELIALDQWTDSDAPTLYGGLTIGTLWQFAILDRAEKRLTQDIGLYRVPYDLGELSSVLVGILTSR